MLALFSSLLIKQACQQDVQNSHRDRWRMKREVKQGHNLTNRNLVPSRSLSFLRSLFWFLTFFSAQRTRCSASSSCLHNAIPYGMITSQNISISNFVFFAFLSSNAVRAMTLTDCLWLGFGQLLYGWCKNWSQTDLRVTVTLDHTVCVYMHMTLGAANHCLIFQTNDMFMYIYNVQYHFRDW